MDTKSRVTALSTAGCFGCHEKLESEDPGSATGTDDVLETLTVPVRVRSERSPRSLRLEPLEVVEDIDWLAARREDVATAREADMRRK